MGKGGTPHEKDNFLPKWGTTHENTPNLPENDLRTTFFLTWEAPTWPRNYPSIHDQNGLLEPQIVTAAAILAAQLWAHGADEE